MGAWRRRNPLQDASRVGARRHGCQIASELRLARLRRGTPPLPLPPLPLFLPRLCADSRSSAPFPSVSLPIPAPLRPFPPFLCRFPRLCAEFPQKISGSGGRPHQVERLAAQLPRLIEASRRRAAESRDSLPESSRLRELPTPRRLGDYTATIRRLYRDSKIIRSI